MSFSYGSIPPPESPPLRATPLSPAPPARTDRRTKRHTTMDLSMAGLNLNDGLANDPLDLNNGRRSDSSSSGSSSFSQERAKRQSSAGAIPVPKMINPLPAHYRHPSPAPSSQSTASVPSLLSHESSASSITSSKCSLRSLAPKPSHASLRDASLCTVSSTDSLSSNEPSTPTTGTFARSRLVFLAYYYETHSIPPTLPPLFRLTHHPHGYLFKPFSSAACASLFNSVFYHFTNDFVLFTVASPFQEQSGNSPQTSYLSREKIGPIPIHFPPFQRFLAGFPENKPIFSTRSL